MKTRTLHWLILGLLAFNCSDPYIKEIESAKINSDFRDSEARTSLACSGFPELIDDEGQQAGGGVLYPSSKKITQSQATVVVNNVAQLRTALNNAQSGNVIYIHPDSTILIDNINDHYLPLKSGVTLASGRGLNGSCGGTIRTTLYGNIAQCGTCSFSDWVTSADEIKGRHIFRIEGPNVRVTGINFVGPFSDIGSGTLMKGKSCIDSNGFDNLLIDNNEFYGWPYEAITVKGGSKNNVSVEFNHIHHNRQSGFGYGVSIAGSSFALIKGNVFNDNRHDIANQGHEGSGFEASYNVVKEGTSFNFDSHGGCDFGGTDGQVAGSYFHIHHNLFMGTSSEAYVWIRGIPKVMCLVEKNLFAKPVTGNIIVQRTASCTTNNDLHENLFTFNNVYNYNQTLNTGTYAGHYVSRNWSKKTSLALLPAALQYQMQAFEIGDFNDDDTTELLVSKNNSWRKIDYPQPEKFASTFNISAYNWSVVRSSYTGSLNNVAFADFDGDGRTDALEMNGTSWLLASPASGAFNSVNLSGYTKSQVRFGDFDGNGKVDVFMANGLKWFISKGAVTDWVDINNSGYLVPDLAFGYFDSNDKFDVFRTNQVNWSYCDGGQGGWLNINGSGEPFNNLIFADINKDHRTDVLVNYGNYHRVSWNGTSGWVDLKYSGTLDLRNSW